MKSPTNCPTVNVRLSFRSGGVHPQRSSHLAGAMKHDTGLTRPLFGMQKPEMEPSLPWECLSKSDANVARSSSKLNQFTPVNSTFPDVWKHVPANQRGRYSALRVIFMGHT